MLRKFRTMNIDYEIVGFYQSHQFGAGFTHVMIKMVFNFPKLIYFRTSLSLCLIIKPWAQRMSFSSTIQSRLAKDSYRCALGVCRPLLLILLLRTTGVQNCNYLKDLHSTRKFFFSVKSAGINYENMFEELPIIIKSSYLNNVLMAELALTKSYSSDKYSTRHFDLGSKKSLEKSVRAMMANVDELNKSIQSMTKYTMDKQRHDNMVFSLTQKRVSNTIIFQLFSFRNFQQQENEARQARGDPPLPLEDIKRIKAPQLQTRNGLLDELLASFDTNALADFSKTVTGENITKLFMAEAVAEEKVMSARERGGTMTSISSSTR